MRFLPNPFWIDELRPLTGLDEPVRDYVRKQPRSEEFLDRYEGLVALLTDGFLHEDKHFLTIAIGCTGGRHRSVAMAEAFAERLRAHGVRTLVVHRDLGPRMTMPSSRSAAGTGWRRACRALRLLETDLTGVVTVADNGGSSGRLRDELGVLPPGDLRMALAALCADDEWGRQWAAHPAAPVRRQRPAARPLRRQPADRRHLGDPRRPRRRARPRRRSCSAPAAGCCRWPRSRSTSRPTSTCGPHPIGSRWCAARCRSRASTARSSASGSTPPTRRPAPRRSQAVKDADWVVIGPGSWFTSVMPTLLVPGAARRARRHQRPAHPGAQPRRSRRARPRGCRRPTTSRCSRRMRPTWASTWWSPTHSLSDDPGQPRQRSRASSAPGSSLADVATGPRIGPARSAASCRGFPQILQRLTGNRVTLFITTVEEFTTWP